MVASIPEVPGAHSQGRTREEARANVIDALRGILELRFSGHRELSEDADSEPLELVIGACAALESGRRQPYTGPSMARTRTQRLGPAARPVVVPEDLDDPSLSKARGEVELPLHIGWSGPPITYDLNDRVDRARVYEQVLREGTESDIRFYVDADHLRELLDELVLPPPVRRAWVDWLQRHRDAA